MAFSSKLYGTEPIINDDPGSMQFAEPGADDSKGLELGLRGPGEYEYGDAAKPFPAELLIPRSEWQARIEEMEEQKSRISDRIFAKQFPHKDQGRTNYCWINAPCHCVEVKRLMANQKPIILSPASAGAKIKNYRNVGGWGKEGLEFIAKNGLVPVDKWPANAIDRKYDTEENAKLALDYRAVEWFECRPRNDDELMSGLLRRMPGAGGYNWWGHEVSVLDPVWLDGTHATRIRNSWQNWGEFGFGILQGSKMRPDDLVFLVSVLAA